VDLSLTNLRRRLRRPNRPSPSPSQSDPRPASSGLPVGRTDQWIIGWKATNLIIDPDTGEILLEQVHLDGLTSAISLDDEASCGQWSHASPHPDCRCGFNAWQSRDMALDYMRRLTLAPAPGYLVTSNLVLARVGLYGRVLEGTLMDKDDWGYRSSRQRVHSIYIPTKCGWCDQLAVMLAVGDGEHAACWNPCRPYLRPACESCAVASERSYNLASLAEAQGIKLKWLEDQPAAAV